jgi:hypothetical protein
MDHKGGKGDQAANQSDAPAGSDPKSQGECCNDQQGYKQDLEKSDDAPPMVETFAGSIWLSALNSNIGRNGSVLY